MAYIGKHTGRLIENLVFKKSTGEWIDVDTLPQETREEWRYTVAKAWERCTKDAMRAQVIKMAQ